jgi:hypothetical protein
MKESVSLFTSPGFLVSLFLLLLNDFFLKSYLHNSLTGKLSDFAGLFVFSLFWVSFFPRFRSWIYLATAGFFVFWKSPASAALIDSWNGIGLFSISRTVDYSDLIALTILPVSYFYGVRAVGLVATRALPAMMVVVSVFAFTATSFSHKTSYGKDYSFPMKKHELLQRMSRLSEKYIDDMFWEADDFRASIEPCLDAAFSVREQDQQTVLTLKETDYRCPTPPSREEMLKTFEQELIEQLSESPTTRPSKIRYLTGSPKFSSPSPSPSLKKPPGKAITR